MDSRLSLLIAIEIGIAITEVLLWMLFRMKALPISFPHETDNSSLRFFTFGRLRLLIIAHTLCLMIVIAIIYLSLW